MTLDPQPRAILEGMLALTGPPAHEVPVDQARAATRRRPSTWRARARGREVRDLEHRCAGIPVRVYRPEGRPGRSPTCTAAGGCSARSTPSTRSAARWPTRPARSWPASATGSRPRPRSRPASRTACARSGGWRQRELGGDRADRDRRRQRRRQPRHDRRPAAAREVDLRRQVLIYPVTDAAATRLLRRLRRGHGLTAASMQRFWNLYLNGSDGLHPDASPLRAPDLAGSPPASC